ncbi:DUF3027 domain-containing protein [Nocardia thailandica]
MSAVSSPESGVRPVLADAADLARRALVELEPEGVGAHLGVSGEDESAATHWFETTLAGYHGWQWAVVVAAPPGAERATVSESALLPGPDALTAPDFLPWEQRVRPGDLSPGDLLAPPADDPRLVPGYIATGDPVVDEVCEEVGLGRKQVLSLEGRLEAATRWYLEYGPDTDMARAAPSTCGRCGFYLPLAGALRESFGVCANAMGADGHTVHVEYGCGAHSDVVAPSGQGSPRYEAYDDAAVELVPAEELRAPTGGTQADADTAAQGDAADAAQGDAADAAAQGDAVGAAAHDDAADAPAQGHAVGAAALSDAVGAAAQGDAADAPAQGEAVGAAVQGDVADAATQGDVPDVAEGDSAGAAAAPVAERVAGEVTAAEIAAAAAEAEAAAVAASVVGQAAAEVAAAAVATAVERGVNVGAAVRLDFAGAPNAEAESVAAAVVGHAAEHAVAQVAELDADVIGLQSNPVVGPQAAVPHDVVTDAAGEVLPESVVDPADATNGEAAGAGAPQTVELPQSGTAADETAEAVAADHAAAERAALAQGAEPESPAEVIAAEADALIASGGLGEESPGNGDSSSVTR